MTSAAHAATQAVANLRWDTSPSLDDITAHWNRYFPALAVATDGAVEALESLQRLGTDYFDLYQLHAVTSLEDVETIFSDGGAMKTFLEAQKEGKVRFLGFSAHSVEAAMAELFGKVTGTCRTTPSSTCVPLSSAAS